MHSLCVCEGARVLQAVDGDSEMGTVSSAGCWAVLAQLELRSGSSVGPLGCDTTSAKAHQ